MEDTSSRETQLRDSTPPRITSLLKLLWYIWGLVRGRHDYGSCVYAMSLSALASCADLDFIRRTRRIEGPFSLVNYEKLLYPQYLNREEFPSYFDLMSTHRQWLAEEAKKKIAETHRVNVHPDVLAHWEMLAKRDEGAA